jgi:hypothetical protein
VFSLAQNATIRNLTAYLRVSGRLVVQKYDELRVSGKLGVARCTICLQVYVCLEGRWPQNKTNYVCLEGLVWQKCLLSQFDCKFTCVWKAGG